MSICTEVGAEFSTLEARGLHAGGRVMTDPPDWQVSPEGNSA